MQTFLKSILILHKNSKKSKFFKQIYRLKLAFFRTSCIYFTELHLTFHLTSSGLSFYGIIYKVGREPKVPVLRGLPTLRFEDG